MACALLHIFTMPSKPLRRDLIDLQKDLELIALLEETRYLNNRRGPPVPKLSNIDFAWEFAQDLAHHQRFVNMPHASPLVFLTVLDLIEDHHVFKNDTNLGQTPH
jgi:hypothetical protein